MSKADATLFNKASQVAIARDGHGNIRRKMTLLQPRPEQWWKKLWNFVLDRHVA